MARRQFSESFQCNGWTDTRRSTPLKSQAALQGLGRAGRTSSKESSFRNNRVLCDVCDEDPPRMGTRLSKVVKNQQSGRYTNNTYWRKHDPHHWTQQPHIEADARIHRHNWFTEEQELVRGEQKRTDRVKRQEEYHRYVKDNPPGLNDYKRKLSEAEKQLKIQQKKCSWNNPLDTRWTCPMPSKPPTGSVNIDPDKFDIFPNRSSMASLSKENKNATPLTISNPTKPRSKSITSRQSKTGVRDKRRGPHLNRQAEFELVEMAMEMTDMEKLMKQSVESSRSATKRLSRELNPLQADSRGISWKNM